MSKAKSAIITAILIVAILVAAFFAVVTLPIGKTQRLNSIASSISLGSDFTGYAYTTIYPEGVISSAEYGYLSDEEKASYEKVGGVYVDKDEHSDIEELKKSVKEDAEKLSSRFGKKGYSSYSVSVEDGVSVKVSVPTNFSYAAYKQLNESDYSNELTYASSAISTLVASGRLTLRTTEQTITDSDSEEHTMYTDEYTETATVSSSYTYSLLGTNDDAADMFKGATASKLGTATGVTLKLTKEGREKFKEVTTYLSASSETLYIFVGNTQVVALTCDSAIDESSVTISYSDTSSIEGDSARNAAIIIDSAVNGGVLNETYRDIESVSASTAEAGDNAAIFLGVACLIILAAVAAALIVKYKKLGAIMALICVLLTLVDVYALFLLDIQVTFAVTLTSLAGLGVYVVSNMLTFAQIKRFTETGRTMQASVKEGYKKTLTSVLELYIILLAAAILLATVAVGEAAACGLIAVVGVVASYVTYWFTRFMWFAASSSARDKFAFVGLKRTVYEDD